MKIFNIRVMAPLLLGLLISAASFAAPADRSQGPPMLHMSAKTVDRLNIGQMEVVIGDHWYRLSSNTRVYLPGKSKPGTIYNLKEGQKVRVVAGTGAGRDTRDVPVAEIHVLE